MSYLPYVIGAYVFFAVVLLWDFVVPRLQIRQLLRTARSRKVRTPHATAPVELSR